MNHLEWSWPSNWPQPVRRLFGALVATVVLVGAAIWLIWQPAAAAETHPGVVGAPVLLEIGSRFEGMGANARNYFMSGLLVTILLLIGYTWIGVRSQLVRYFEDRHAAMQAVKDSTTMNVALLNALPDTIFLTDRDGTILDTRERVASYGRTAASLDGTTLFEAFSERIAVRMLRTVRCAIDLDDTQSLVYAEEGPDGTCHYEVRAAAYSDDRALVIVRDITEKEHAEQSIREAESKFRILVEQSLTGIYIIQEGRFVYVNPRFAEVFGYEPQELLDLDSVLEILVPEDRPDMRRRLEKGADGADEGSHFTIRGIRSDQTVIYAEIFRSVIEYNGEPAIIGTLLDVTEQREAQEQLRVLGMAVEQSAEGVLVIDTAGIVCFVNPAWARMHGYDVSEVTGHHFRIFHTEEQLRRDVFPVINRFEQTSIYRAEMGRKRKDGSTFMSSTAFASLRDDDGRVIGAVGICRDITEQKQYEAELLAAKEQAEDLSRMKSAFLTNMSHEIRTPLTGILGFAKILEDELPADQREFAHLIQVSGDRLMNTLNSILELARLEAGEIQLAPHHVNLTEEVLDAVTVFQAIAREKDLDFDVCVGGDKLPAQVDRNMLNIILNNLLGNAVKFTDHGEIAIELEATEEEAFIAVTDTGVGIDADFLPHLFDEFKQESDGLTRSHEGSGLGLSITKRLVDLMGGTIEVESEKGKGSRFEVTFPRYIEQRDVLEMSDALASAGHNVSLKASA